VPRNLLKAKGRRSHQERHQLQQGREEKLLARKLKVLILLLLLMIE